MTSLEWFCAVMTAIAFLGSIGLVLVLRPTGVFTQKQEADVDSRQTQIGHLFDERQD